MKTRNIKLYVNPRLTKLDKVKMIGAKILQVEDDYKKASPERKQQLEPVLNSLKSSYQNHYMQYRNSLN